MMEPENTSPKRPASSTTQQESQLDGASSDDRWGTYFLGPYRVVDELGIGGMATVELARMDGAGGFQKWVAIKRIHPHLTEDVQFINMFLDEARIAASISHPNVAQVFDLGCHENQYWIAMEYLHGEPVREVMRRNEELGGKMRPELAARVIADAAEGLHAAHELRGKDGQPLNLVHRDVSPHNLFLTYDGVVKVVDFGIAKVAGGLSNTHAGTLKGKLAYMAPEQVKGMPIDRRTDIFALGVVLWELTTGRRLFRVESDLGTLSRVEACAVPPPSSMADDYPHELEVVLLHALQKEPKDRFQTAREFSRALQRYLMKVNCFVGPEEISRYLTALFKDRVHQREAHLRWAAEVTQTVSIDALSKARAGSRDLIELSALPQGTDSGDSMEFDTIRDQMAPEVHGIPSPLGEPAGPRHAEPVQAPPQQNKKARDPLAQTRKATPLSRAELEQQLSKAASNSASVKISVMGDALGALPSMQPCVEDDDDDDEIQTLIATAPGAANGLPEQLERARAQYSDELARGVTSTEGDANEPSEDSIAKTMAFVRSVEGSALRIDVAPPTQAEPRRLPTMPAAEQSAEAAPAQGAQSVPGAVEPAGAEPDPARHLAQGVRATPSFPGLDDSSAGESMLANTARNGPSALVLIAAALGAAFVGAGAAALIWVKSQAARPRPPSPQPLTRIEAGPASAKATATTQEQPVRVVGALPSSTASTAPPTASTALPAPAATPASRPAPATYKAVRPPPVKPATPTRPVVIPDLPDDERSLEDAPPGFLTVMCRPACDMVSAGGRALGPGASRAPLPPGQYRVKLRRGAVEKIITAIVVSGQHTSHAVSME